MSKKQGNFRLVWLWPWTNLKEILPRLQQQFSFWNNGMREEWFGIFPRRQLTIFFLWKKVPGKILYFTNPFGFDIILDVSFLI
jgi:hypothetical protein